MSFCDETKKKGGNMNIWMRWSVVLRSGVYMEGKKSYLHLYDDSSALRHSLEVYNKLMIWDKVVPIVLYSISSRTVE